MYSKVCVVSMPLLTTLALQLEYQSNRPGSPLDFFHIFKHNSMLLTTADGMLMLFSLCIEALEDNFFHSRRISNYVR